VDDVKWHSGYDHRFSKHAKHYFGAHFDWRWFKAQGISESTLGEHARSNRGARGVMQILPTTYAEIFQDHTLLPGITDPKWNIAAGIAYNRYLYERWARRLPTSQRLAFTLGSYNAGYRKISNARQQAKASGLAPDRWTDVAAHAPRQTRKYVQRIFDLMAQPL
jgi:membrane-bound lytic murein transglycosylase F